MCWVSSCDICTLMTILKDYDAAVCCPPHSALIRLTCKHLCEFKVASRVSAWLATKNNGVGHMSAPKLHIKNRHQTELCSHFHVLYWQQTHSWVCAAYLLPLMEPVKKDRLRSFTQFWLPKMCETIPADISQDGSLNIFSKDSLEIILSRKPWSNFCQYIIHPLFVLTLWLRFG